MPKRKVVTKKSVEDNSLSESTLQEPLATSSPGCRPSENYEAEIKRFEEESRSAFNTFLESLPPALLNSNALELINCIRNEINEQSDKNETEIEKKTKEELKLPMSVPKSKKKDASVMCASSCKSVHWDVTSKDNSESDVFKTPPKKGQVAKGGASTSTCPKTPKSLVKEPYAVVTPGPMMNNRIKLLRMPQAGETALSLSGSPLLVTPFGANNSTQAALTVSTDTGYVMTIVKPEQESPSDDTEMFAPLESETKAQIIEFATYLLKNVNGGLPQ